MINYNTTDYDKALEAELSKDKEVILSAYQRNFSIQEESLEQIVIGIEHTEYNKFKDTKLIWNIAGNISIISYDLKIIVRDLSFASSEWQKRHYARQACLLIHESLEDLFRLLGKEFVELTKNRLNITELQTDLKNIRTSLNDFKTVYSEDLRNIRNYVTAHRDKELLKQVYIIKQINWSQCLDMTLKFNKILEKLGIFLNALVKKGLKELSELKSYRKSTKRLTN
jgi:hypothetical protein